MDTAINHHNTTDLSPGYAGVYHRCWYKQTQFYLLSVISVKSVGDTYLYKLISNQYSLFLKENENRKY